jgi:L-lactate dehydrogenase complex protein LldG
MATPQAFITRLRTALGHRRRHRPSPDAFMPDDYQNALKTIQCRDKAGQLELLDLLTQRAKGQNIVVKSFPDVVSATRAVAGLVREKKPEWGDTKQVVAWKHPLIKALNLPVALHAQQVPVFFTEPAHSDSGRQKMRHKIIGSFIGITSADHCVAETATLVLKTKPGHARSVSLLPAIHIAVLHLDQMLKNTLELYALLKWHPDGRQRGLGISTTFITGASKTADIEATLIHGAHGPRELYIFVVTGSF